MKTYKFQVFTAAIEENIRNGAFRPGHKLPSVREIKAQYRISTTTVQSGYEYLMISGWVESIPKSGYYVSHRMEMPARPSRTRHRPIARDAVFRSNLALTTSLRMGKKISEFNVAAPGDLLIPQKMLLRTLQQVIREQGAGLLRYYPPDGSPQLKEKIIQRAAPDHALILPEELIITDGALQALYIALATVCTAGDIIALESPCVFSVLEVVRVLKLKVVEIPVDPATGFDMDFFDKVCRTNKVKAVVVTPNFHNPTGSLMTDVQKIKLLAIALQYDIALIENDIYGDLYFLGQRPAAIKKFDDSGQVITCSSYAKTLAPGIRLGWLSAGKYAGRAEQVKFALGSTVSPLYQETISRLLGGTAYERHLRSLRVKLAKNMFFAMNLIATHFPEGTGIIQPSGGYNLWIKMPDATDMNNFYQQCEATGIRFTPGSTFSFTDAYDQYFRLVIADVFSPQRTEAIRRLGQRLNFR